MIDKSPTSSLESPSSEEFSAAVTRSLARGLSKTDIADEFKVSEATVDRWENGKSAPVAGIRNIVVERLEKLMPGVQ